MLVVDARGVRVGEDLRLPRNADAELVVPVRAQLAFTVDDPPAGAPVGLEARVERQPRDAVVTGSADRLDAME